MSTNQVWHIIHLEQDQQIEKLSLGWQRQEGAAQGESGDSELAGLVHCGQLTFIQGLAVADSTPGATGRSRVARARHPWPAWWVRRAPAQSTRGMMVKGTAGLLASSSKAVRKHSVAAASLPCAWRTSPSPFQTSWAVEFTCTASRRIFSARL